jgi:predicted AAA+ superfamily ATPase
VTVAAIDASKAGTPIFAMHGATKVKSVWGELAWQLRGADGLEAPGEADDPQAKPTEDQIESLLPPGPVLVLLDELVIYMATLGEQAQGCLIAFLNNLAAICGRRPQTVLVVTDPADQRAYAKQAAQLSDELTAAVKLDDMFGRKASDFDPIGNETARVITTRLFESVESGAAHSASGEYFALFSRVNAESPGSIPPNAATAPYAQRIIDCYPFHPRLSTPPPTASAPCRSSTRAAAHSGCSPASSAPSGRPGRTWA